MIEVSVAKKIPPTYLKHPSLTDPSASIFSYRVFGKNVSGSVNFLPLPLLLGRCFAVFKHTQMMYAGYVKIAPGKPQTGRVKLQISSGTGEAILTARKEKIHWVCYRGRF